MSGSEDLKDLLDRLKDEVGPLPEEPAPAQRQAAPRPALQPRPAPAPERFFRARRPEPRPQPAAAPANPVWSENKEAMLFGLLTSLIAVFGGILSGLGYVVLIGAVAFLLFACLMALALYAYYLNFRGPAREDRGLAERLDALSRRVEALSSMAVSGGSSAPDAPFPEKERELERKVEELRVIVKTLARSAERQG
ncbi:MAG: hypothetical protein M0025_06565 [Elusimicrobia bacterium]|nr:hypothetical protein [Elusimicrobiota bacterium]